MSGPIEMEVIPHGKINSVIVEAPSKVMVEIIGKKK